MEWEESKKTYLTRNLFGAVLAIGVGLFSDPLGALVGIRERMHGGRVDGRRRRRRRYVVVGLAAEEEEEETLVVVVTRLLRGREEETARHGRGRKTKTREEGRGKHAKTLKQGIRAQLLVGTELVSHIQGQLFKQPALYLPTKSFKNYFANTNAVV